MPDLETLTFSLVARMENGFGRLEEGQRQNRLASEARTKDLHKRIDRLEDHTKSEFKEIRSKMERSKAPISTTSFLKVASALLAHWQIIATVLLIAAGILMGKSPDTIKAWVGSIK